MSREKLLRIYKSNAVEGFVLKGQKKTSCGCDTCAQAKLQRNAIHHHRLHSDPATYLGHTVSTDVKVVPYPSFRGFKYVVNFVDHATRFGMCYFVRSKTEIPKQVEKYLADMRHLGVIVRTIQSDRGMEYFSQEGDIISDRDRKLSEFDRICAAQEPKVKHVLQPIEMKEKVAEIWFKDHFRAANAFLWEARLSPAFWADAIAYSQYLWNRTPNDHVGDTTTPWTILTGEKPRWDRFRVFGCDVWEHIPNNQYYKIPGIPRGRRLIFLGFEDGMKGWKCFDPEKRVFRTCGNVYFNEDFTHRIDALRHHDRRRALLRADLDQPVQLDDFTDPNSSAVRNLYLDADTPVPQASVENFDSRDGAAEESDDKGKSRTRKEESHVGTTRGRKEESHVGTKERKKEESHVGTKERKKEESYKDSTTQRNKKNESKGNKRSIGSVRGRFENRVTGGDEENDRSSYGTLHLRPLRLLPVGTPVRLSDEDKKFLKYAMMHNIPVSYLQPCPKIRQSASRDRYLRYMHATTLSQALELGTSVDDIYWDYQRGFIKFPRHESLQPGHIYHVASTFIESGVAHVATSSGVESGLFVDLSTRRQAFQDAISGGVPSPPVLSQFHSREQADRWAATEFAKVFAAAAVDYDHTLPPEPTTYAESLSDKSSEAREWKLARDEEMESMRRFEVYKRVPISQARGHQILGARWVFKRKIGRDGRVSRYRARLVVQGYRQKPWDSFNPDEISAPVGHKDSIRLMLSIAAAENMHIHQADIKAAFLQAPLKEKIYVRAPQGYESRTASGEEEVLELSQAIYGLKQAGACFFDAAREHLLSLGFQSMVGDPCLYKRVDANGGVIIVCTYVDDFTFAVSDPSLIPTFMAELRQRFVIDDGEGGPISYILGIAVDQSLEKGTVHLCMELAITKLCKHILTDEELARAVLVDSPISTTPLQSRSDIESESSPNFDYLSAVGSILHVANCVRPDVSFAVGYLARFAANPGPQHVKAAKRVLLYLFNTRTLGITYYRESRQEKNRPILFEGAKHPLDDGSNLTQVFVDSDYAGDESRRSTQGCVVLMNSGPIAWFSVLGKTVALSTCEAEINAAVAAAKDALHISRLLKDLGYEKENRPIQIAEDNAAAIAQAESGLRSVRKAKHYEVKLAFLQQLVLSKDIAFRYCPTALQRADLLTKALPSDQHLRLTGMLLSYP